MYRGITVFEKLMVHNDPDIDLVSDNEYTDISLRTVSMPTELARELSDVLREQNSFDSFWC